MRRRFALVVLMAILAVACGGGSGDQGGDDDSTGNGASTGGEVVDPQPPGQGYAAVDGLEYTFDTPGLQPCEVSNEGFKFSFVIGDNEVNFGGGASIQRGDWWGSLTLLIWADNAVTEYGALLIDNPSAIAIDGNSVSYSGPMEKFEPTSDGSLSDPVDVGNGVFSVTCG